MKRLILTCLSLSLMLSVTAAPLAAYAYDPLAICNQANAQSSTLCANRSSNQTNPLTGTNGLFRQIINVLALLSGLLAVVMLIVGGLRYITSGGDPAQIKSAQTTIVAALTGLVILALAESIIAFVVSRV